MAGSPDHSADPPSSPIGERSSPPSLAISTTEKIAAGLALIAMVAALAVVGSFFRADDKQRHEQTLTEQGNIKPPPLE